MIYYHLQTQSILEAYFYLEELICLSEITNQKCSVKISSDVAHYFDLSNFELIENLPDLSTLPISNYVCVYDGDLKTQQGKEFIFYKPKRQHSISRLEKYKNCIIQFDAPNYYESKYFTIQTQYEQAIHKASKFNFKFSNNYVLERIKSYVKPLPFVCLNSNVFKNPEFQLPFDEFYYYSENNVSDQLKNYKAHSIVDYILSYFPNENPYVFIPYLTNHFSDIFGQTYDLLYAIMCKEKYKNNANWKINILGYNSGFITENYSPKIIHKNATFDFSKFDINEDRQNLLSLMRFSNCVVV